MKLFSDLEDVAVLEMESRYNAFTDEAKALFHDTIGVYQTHPGAAFLAGVIVATAFLLPLVL